MSDEIQFKYFYGTESEMLTFYRIPKLLVTSKYFKTLTNDAKKEMMDYQIAKQDIDRFLKIDEEQHQKDQNKTKEQTR